MKNNKLIALLSIWLLALTCLYLYGFTYTIDCANPVGTMAPSVLDDYARNDKYGWAERLNVEHYFALTGTQVSDAATGQHRQIEFYGPITKPTSAANKSWLYAKDVSAKTELHWEDEDGDEVQFTSGGVFNIALLTSTTITTPTLTSPVINTGVSGTAILDEDDMASNSATKLATQQSIKTYVDGSFPDDDAFGTWASKSNNTSDIAASDGFVCAYAQWSGSEANVIGYTDASNPPTTIRLRSRVMYNASDFVCITLPVKKGDYWKVTGADTIFWLPLGG